METPRTATVRNLHKYARPAEASPFFKACTVAAADAAARAETDRILAQVFASKTQQWGSAATILDRNPETH